jgi:hypothetical protein
MANHFHWFGLTGDRRLTDYVCLELEAEGCRSAIRADLVAESAVLVTVDATVGM